MYEATEHGARAGAEDPGSTHAFRIAEKRFQRRVTKSSKKTGKGKLVEEAVDLSDVVDPSCATFDEDGLHRSENWGEVRRCRRRAAGLDAVVIGRSDWDAYAAANTTTHVAESIRMKVEDIRRIIF